MKYMTDWTDEAWTVSCEVRTWPPLNWEVKQIPKVKNLLLAKNSSFQNTLALQPRHDCSHPGPGGEECVLLVKPDCAFILGPLGDERQRVSGVERGWGRCWERGKRRSDILEDSAQHRKWVKATPNVLNSVYSCSLPVPFPATLSISYISVVLLSLWKLLGYSEVNPGLLDVACIVCTWMGGCTRV